jgi:hypothetical protein
MFGGALTRGLKTGAWGLDLRGEKIRPRRGQLQKRGSGDGGRGSGDGNQFEVKLCQRMRGIMQGDRGQILQSLGLFQNDTVRLLGGGFFFDDDFHGFFGRRYFSR